LFVFPASTLASMWCLRGCYSKVAPGTVKRAILRLLEQHGADIDAVTDCGRSVFM